MKSQIDEKQNESTKFKSLWEASKESLKKQKNASEDEIKSLRRDIQLFREEKDVLSREHSLHLSSANKNLSKTKEELEKLAKEKEELSRSKSLEETTRKNLEKEHETLKRANSDLASQVKLFKTESVKMKRKMVELVEAENKSQKSEAENEELRRNLLQKDDTISVLSKEVERAKHMEKKQLSMIEMFKEQVKNGKEVLF